MDGRADGWVDGWQLGERTDRPIDLNNVEEIEILKDPREYKPSEHATELPIPVTD